MGGEWVDEWMDEGKMDEWRDRRMVDSKVSGWIDWCVE